MAFSEQELVDAGWVRDLNPTIINETWRRSSMEEEVEEKFVKAEGIPYYYRRGRSDESRSLIAYRTLLAVYHIDSKDGKFLAIDFTDGKDPLKDDPDMDAPMRRIVFGEVTQVMLDLGLDQQFVDTHFIGPVDTDATLNDLVLRQGRRPTTDT